MNQPEWKFRQKLRAEMHHEPANTEFFAAQDVADRLVREAGQNTLDARADAVDGPVRLVFSFIEADARTWDTYFSSLWPHLEAHEELRERLPTQGDRVPCLLVEDFGTTGLTGPLEPENFDEAEEDEPNHRLFWFFKNIGRTSKRGDRLGSFGIGKTVFPYSSQINSYFGLTTRAATPTAPDTVLLGQSQLKEHRLPEHGNLEPFGFYAWHEGESDQYERRPISEPNRLARFRRDFQLARQPDNSGLSIIIPFPEPQLSSQTVAAAALTHFFLPILNGQLEVEVRGIDDSIILQRADLGQAVERLVAASPDLHRLGMRERIALAAWAAHEGADSSIALDRPSSYKQPRFDEAMLPPDHRRSLSERFVQGERLAFRVPVPIEPRSATTPTWSFIDLFIEYDRTLSISDDHYAREGLTVIDHRGQARQPGLRALLIARDSAVAQLLRASENVAHTKWRQKGADRLSQAYERGPSKVGFVLGITPELVQSLLAPEDVADWWTLADIFPVPMESPVPATPHSDRPDTADTSGGQNDPSGEDPTFEPEEDQYEIESRIRQYRRYQLPDGFRISGNPDFDGPLQPMRVEAVYAVFGGKGKHHPHDFSFKNTPRMVEAVGADCDAEDHNKLVITPVNRDFEVRVRGFDQRRALDYRVKILEVV